METTPELTGPQRAFLAAFAVTGIISRAAAAAEIDRQCHYNWLEASPLYQKAFRLAKEEAADALELEARRRATEGLVRKKFDRFGKPLIDPDTHQQYVEHEYSDRLLEVLLKAHRPEKFRERFEVTGADGAPLLSEGERADRIAQIFAAARARAVLAAVADAGASAAAAAADRLLGGSQAADSAAE